MGRRAQSQARRGLTPDFLRSREGRQGMRLLRQFRRRKPKAPEETIVSAGLIDLDDEPELPLEERPPGPATLRERRRQLDQSLPLIIEDGDRLEFRANAIAVIRREPWWRRLLRRLLALLLLPFALLLRLLRWLLGSGSGRMGRNIVAVDRSGRVVVRKA